MICRTCAVRTSWHSLAAVRLYSLSARWIFFLSFSLRAPFVLFCHMATTPPPASVSALLPSATAVQSSGELRTGVSSLLSSPPSGFTGFRSVGRLPSSRPPRGRCPSGPPRGRCPSGPPRGRCYQGLREAGVLWGLREAGVLRGLREAGVVGTSARPVCFGAPAGPGL